MGSDEVQSPWTIQGSHPMVWSAGDALGKCQAFTFDTTNLVTNKFKTPDFCKVVSF